MNKDFGAGKDFLRVGLDCTLYWGRSRIIVIENNNGFGLARSLEFFRFSLVSADKSAKGGGASIVKRKNACGA
jgi:hypothetical protein